MVLNVHRNRAAYLGRGEGGEGGMEVGVGIYISLHFHYQNDFCIKMGSDESHFNVSEGSDGQSHRTVSTNYFEEKGEPKRYRTEVLPLSSLTPYRWAKPAHCVKLFVIDGFYKHRLRSRADSQHSCSM